MDLKTITGLDQVLATVIVNVLLALLSAFSAYAVAWLRKHVKGQNLAIALDVAKVAVKAAESVGTAYGYDSKAKFEYAVNSARKVGEAHGINFTDEQWEAFIEQAHHQLVILTEELAAGPTVDPSQPASPEPAGPPGPQTPEGEELTGIGGTESENIVVAPARSELPLGLIHHEGDSIELEDHHGAFRREERG